MSDLAIWHHSRIHFGYMGVFSVLGQAAISGQCIDIVCNGARVTACEANFWQPGSEAVVNRLSEIVFVQTIRAHAQTHKAGAGILSLPILSRIAISPCWEEFHPAKRLCIVSAGSISA
jgi:hypothetical protein